jgi:flagellar biosynthesis/type III secretory pathway chaperone
MPLEISALLKILNQQNNLIAELEKLVNRQLQALMKEDLNEITSITGQQEYVGRQIDDLEEQRQLIIADYSRIIGVEIKHFSELKQFMTSNDWNEIQKLRNDITNCSQKIKRENERNSLLLRQELKYTGKMLQILEPNKSSVYGKSGGLNQAVGRRIVDTNV